MSYLVECSYQSGYIKNIAVDCPAYASDIFELTRPLRGLVRLSLYLENKGMHWLLAEYRPEAKEVKYFNLPKGVTK